MPVAPERAPLAAQDANGATALLIVDMISLWDFDDAEPLLQAAGDIAPRIAALKARCVAADVPIAYANDNQGHWRSEFHRLVEESMAHGGAGAAITQMLRPSDDDYSVLKPKHSAFFATPLDLLLRHLRARRLIVTGVATDQCIAQSAMEARMRDYEVVVPSDCVAAQSGERNDRALLHLRESCRIETTASARIGLPTAA